MSYYFYILRCADGTLYSGQTNNIAKRIKEHNDSKGRGAKYTRGRGPVTLAYCEEFNSLQAAMKREAEVKKWPKAQKEKLIQKM